MTHQSSRGRAQSRRIQSSQKPKTKEKQERRLFRKKTPKTPKTSKQAQPSTVTKMKKATSRKKTKTRPRFCPRCCTRLYHLYYECGCYYGYDYD